MKNYFIKANTPAIILCVLITAILILLLYTMLFMDSYHKKLRDQNVAELQVQVGEVNFTYAEVTDNGPQLVLLNAQHLDWFSYTRVIQELSQSFHVFAIDYPGHGKTTYPESYEMTADNIGCSLANFIEQVIGEPVYVSGNSSGGLLAVWLSANAKDYLNTVILEDPPLFSSEADRISCTIADRSFETCAKYLNDKSSDDFLMYWLNSNSAFFENNFGKGVLPLLRSAVTIKRANPYSDTMEIWFLPDVGKMMLRGFDMYDPRFGAAFHDGTWNKGFDHAEALSQITCPVLLMQADFTIMEDGTLNGAMTPDDAQLAMSLLPNGTYIRIASSYVIALDQPDEFIHIEKDFFLNLQG